MALALLGMLVAGLTFAGLEEARVGEAARQLNSSFGVAEEGLAEVVHGWEPTTFNVLEQYPLDSARVPRQYPRTWLDGVQGIGSYGGYVYKLNGELYLLDVTGRAVPAVDSSAENGVSQRVRLLVRAHPIDWGIRAAVATPRGGEITGPVRVDGADHLPPGWLACGRGDTVAGVGVRVGASVAVVDPALAWGQPAVAVDSSAASLWKPPYGELSVRATKTLAGQTFVHAIAPVVVGGHCAHTVVTNWGGGDGGPCDGFFPLVHVLGDLTLSGAAGQGILFVDGNLAVLGGFEWRGILAVRGKVLIQPDPVGEVHIWGAVVVEDSVVLRAASGAESPSNLVSIYHSKCAIIKALETVAWVAPLTARGWIGPF
jgi:hypothetical protein